MRLALSLLVFATGCQAIAGIEDVTLADSTSSAGETSNDASDDALNDTTTADADTPPVETSPCTSTRGPAMVEVVHPTGSFCIDVTEVTNEQFAEYAKARPNIEPPSSVCGGVALSYPGPVGDPKGPQFNVTWCDAWAYCSWANKRLCGKIDLFKPKGPANSEWMWSCSQGGTTKYPYGDTFNSSACVSGRTDASALPLAVASSAACTGAAAPYNAIHDMSGNVSEWVAECNGTLCHALGGYYGDTDTQALGCASINSSTSTTVTHEVSTVLSGLGFRCCR